MGDGAQESGSWKKCNKDTENKKVEKMKTGNERIVHLSNQTK